MENIFSILKNFGIEIPEDKKEELSKAVAKEYKTINEVKKLNTKIESLENEKTELKEKYEADIAKRDEDLKTVKEQLESAGTDSTKLQEALAEIETLKTNYANDKKEYEEKLEKQAYDFAVKELVGGLKFTSNSAKKAFINDVTEKGLKLENGKLLGFDDYVAEYKKEDAGAFVAEEDGGDEGNTTPPAKFSDKTAKGDTGEGGEGNTESTPRPLVW